MVVELAFGLFVGLLGLAFVVLSGGLLAVGFRARSEEQAVRWTGYVFLAGFALFMLATLVIAAVSD
jgi:hypothetical protein